MNNSIAINTEEFELLINNLEESFNKINEIFLLLDNKMNCISSSDSSVWASPAQEKAYLYYLKINKLFPLYDNKFASYIVFLRSVCENYKKNEQESNDVIETNTKNLNVNGGV